MKRHDIEFSSEGATLRGWLYTPEGEQKPHPTVIMAPGFSATRTMVFDRYAEAYCDAGFAALLYDHRNFGASGGEPRLEMNPWVQARGYRDAITFAETYPSIDPQRIALWGASNSGGLTLVAGACDARVKAIVVQAPSCGEEHPPPDPDGSRFGTIRETLLGGEVSATPETRSGPMPVMSSDSVRDAPFLRPLTAYRWFIEYGGRLGSNWVNDVTVIMPPTPEPYNAALCVPFIHVPLLMMVAPEDEMVRANPKVSRAAFDACSEPKEWLEIPGGHFGHLYHPSETFDLAIAAGANFLKRFLI